MTAPTTVAANTERETLVRCAIEQAVIWAQKQASRNGLPRHWDLWDAGLVRAAFESFAALSRNALPPAPTTGAADSSDAALSRAYQEAWVRSIRDYDGPLSDLENKGESEAHRAGLRAVARLAATPPAPAEGSTPSEAAGALQACRCRYGNEALVLADPACPVHGKQPETTLTTFPTSPPAPAEAMPDRTPERKAFVAGWLWAIYEFRAERTVDEAAEEYITNGHVRPCPRDFPLLRDGSGA